MNATVQKRRTGLSGVFCFCRENRLNWLLLFIPISIIVKVLQLPAIWLFLTSALALVPLAGLIGAATEELAERVSHLVGGLLNATFGNATELIIAIIALRAGLQDVVKASISGSIIGNILLVLGASMFAGGWKRQRQKFNRTNAGASAAMLFLAVIALVMPAVFAISVYGRLAQTPVIERLSLFVSVVLILTYFASLVFSFRTHRDLFATEHETALPPRLSRWQAVVLLLAASILTAFEAELLVGSISGATHALGMTNFFVGVIVVAIVGNAAEHFSAVSAARKNKMDLAVTISTASSTQIALFVAPVLVFVSYAFSRPMTLIFNIFEIVGIGLSVLILSMVTLDGESNWFEGFQLIAVYLVLAIVFYFVPA